MLRRSASFEQSLAWGEEGEHLIARKLMASGVVVSPLYQFNKQGAPALLYESDERLVEVVAPDLTCWGRRHFFAEVKRKNQWTTFKQREMCACGQPIGPETGFNLRLYRHYLEIALLTGAEVHVFFLHEDSGKKYQVETGVFHAELHSLSGHLREWDGRHEVTGARIRKKPMAMFGRHALRRLWGLEALADFSTEAAE